MALENITKYARSRKYEAQQSIKEVLQMSNIDQKTFEDDVTKVKTHAKVGLHFHPDRTDPTMKTVAEALLEQGIYKSQFDYELILRTDSISIYGSDIYTVDKYSILNTELANLWNPNLDLILKEYREELLSGKLSNEEIKKYSRFTGKDIMKCLQRKILLEYGVWERSVCNMYNSLKEHMPEYSSLYDSLWDLYWLPTDDIERIILVIKQTELIKERYMQ